jgi:hypothetical protein
MNQTEWDAVTAEICKLDAQMKRNETKSLHLMPKKIAYDLEYELSHSNAHAIDDESSGGFVGHVIVAEYQADLYMAAEIKNQAAVMVMTKDSDIPIIAGDCCIFSKSFMKGKFEIVSTYKATLRHATSFMPDASMARVKFNATPNHIFKGISDHWLCALMMLMLVGDVYVTSHM